MTPVLELPTVILAPAAVARSLEAGAAVVDVRDAAGFDAGHAHGAVNVPGGLDAGTVARQLVALDVPVIAMAAGTGRATEAAAELRTGGFRCVLGAAVAPAAGPHVERAAIGRAGAISLDRLADELATGGVLLVDVREAGESRTGRLPGSLHLPLAELRRAAHLLPDVPTVTACTDGRRAAAAASALRRWGHRNVWRVDGGGMDDLLRRRIGLDLLGAA